jgi:cytoskeletal protein CcmA (bactofilin family)
MSSGEFNTVSVSSTLNIGKNILTPLGYPGYLNVYGKSQLNGSLNVVGSMNVKSVSSLDFLTLNIPTVFGLYTKFIGEVDFNNITINGIIKKNVTIGQNLSVNGATFLNNSVNIGSKVDNIININGTSFFNTSVFLGKTLTDKITVNSPLFVNSGMKIIGDSTLSGNVVLGEPKNTIELVAPIINNVKFNSNVNVETLTVNKSVSGPFQVNGETSLNGNVNLGTDINSYINFRGKISNIILSGLTNVDGITNLNGAVSLGKSENDDININGTVNGPLIVKGLSTFKGDLITTGKSIVNGSLTVSGAITTDKLVIGGTEIKSAYTFITVRSLPETSIQINRIYLNENNDYDSRYGIVSGIKYKDIFRGGDKIKLKGVVYTILNTSRNAVTTTNNDAGKWLFLDKPVTNDNTTFELFHHYVLDTDYYNIAEFFIDNSVYNSEIEVVYLYLPFANESSNRPITFINRSFISSTASNVSVGVRTRGKDTINRETDYLDIGKRFTDSESTFQVRLISNGIDTWYII